MKNALTRLDEIQAEIATALRAAVPAGSWDVAKVFARYSPNGVGALDFEFSSDGERTLSRQMPPNNELDRLTCATFKHWQLTSSLGQPRWYMMTIKLERSGKYTVDFEYRDDYKEGDIMQPLP